MPNLIITSAIRESEHNEPSGYIYTLDIEQRRVTGRTPIIEPLHLHKNTNPRGGMRGAKGIAVAPDRIFIANYSAIYCFSPSWGTLGVISHPACAGIHDIVLRNGRLWATSARNNLLLEFDLTGSLRQHFDLLAFARARELLGRNTKCLLTDRDILSGAVDFRDPRTHNYDTYDRMHVNSVCFLPDDSVLVLLGFLPARTYGWAMAIKTALQRAHLWKPIIGTNRLLRNLLHLQRPMHTEMLVNALRGRSAVARIDRNRELDVMLVLEARTPIHSLLSESDGTVIFTDTSSGEIVHFNPDDGRTLSRVKVTQGFLRGIARLSDGTVAAGDQNHLRIIDLHSQAVAERIMVSEDTRETIYDVKMLPPDFQPLPERLFSERGLCRSF